MSQSAADLDPGPVARTRSPDATTLLTVFVCLLLFLPSALVLEPLGSAGAPSNLLGIGALFMWAWFHLHRSYPLETGFQPVRVAVLVWLLVMLAVYAHAMAGPIPYDEISVADSGMLRLFSFAGILLVANDGIRRMDRLVALLKLLVVGTGAIAVFGLVQYVTGELYVDRLAVPGLVNGTASWSIGTRGGFIRPSGTSTSPIEYGVVLTLVLPLAITFATSAPTHRWLYRGCVAAIAFAVFLSGSRSALVCALVGLGVLAVFWTNRRRLVALGCVLTIAVVVFLTVPGSLGTLSKMFTGANEDPSIASRTGSYEIVGHFFMNSPWLGRGFGTLLPRYQILDNAYLGLLIEGGVLGLAGLVAVIGAGAAAALRVHRRAGNQFDRLVGQALLASIVAGATGLAFFDTFAFPQAAGAFFLVLGLAGALHRLVLTPTPRQDPPERKQR